MIHDLKPYPAYKDSALSWVGIIPSHWDEKRAKYLFREVDERSKTGKEELLSVSHITGVTPRSQKNVTMFMAESTVGHKICRPGDLVINTLWAWMGALGVSPLTGLVSPAYGVYRPSEASPLSSAFIGHLLRSPQYVSEYSCRSTGIQSSRLRLYPEQLLEIPIVCPPTDEQRLMLRYLAHVDRRIRRYIAAKKKLIALLSEQKQAIIHRAVTRGLDPDIRLKPSGVEWLGDVPEHWEVKKIHQITDPRRPVMYGIVLPGPNVDDGVYIVKGGNCEPGRLRPERLSRTTYEIEAGYVRSRLRRQDIVFAIRGGVGAAEVVPAELEGANLTQDAARIAPGPGINPQWLLYGVRAPIFREHVQIRVVGATVRGINIRDLKRVDIVVPPYDEQSDIVTFLDRAVAPLDLARARATNEISLLNEYRTRLIADVVTGKLDVREAAAHLPDEADASEPLDEADALTEEDDADPDATSEEAEG